MTKKTSKFFSIFWLIAGLAWTFAVIRHMTVKDDVIGAIIYMIAAIVSFVLAFAYYKNFIK